MLIVVLITGGFVIDAGPLYFSSRRPTTPFLIALGAWLAVALHGRPALAAAGGSLLARLDRHATAIAVAIAAAAAGIGIAYGTYSAAGADAAGYVSQSALIASGRLIRAEPLARQVGWSDATWVFAPLGYRPGQNPGEIVPTYPSGLPLAMAAGRLTAGDTGVFVAVPLLGALAVFCTYALGARLHSSVAGLAGAALLTTSPIFLFHIVQPMSDVPAAAWWALAMCFALSPLPAAALAAGATAGLAVLTRPNLVLLAIPVALVLAGRPAVTRGQGQPRARRVAAFAAGLSPAVATLLLLQWRLHGNPFASGYGPIQELFALSNIAPNLRGYLLRLLTGEAPALCLAALSLAALRFARRQTQPAVSAGPTAWIAALVAITTLVCYLPYGVFSEWWYLRFLLPAFPLAFVLVGALLVNATDALPDWTRGIVLTVALVTACAVNVTIAEREQAFNLHRYEARYRTAGRYLASALPPNAVVLTVQQSGSVAYYTSRPIVRWDSLSVDLDAAIVRLRTLGRQPVLLVEDWERPDLRGRFSTSAISRLDWAPRADIGTETRVGLFDPADRDNPPDRSWTDRLP